MIYLTGDTHGSFGRIGEFCKAKNTTTDDVMIILGDAGINFYGWFRDRDTKGYISTLPITLFCIHGNHEQRPFTIPSYKETVWNGGVVYTEEEYPNIIFAKDGEIYDLDGKRAIAIGGAYSIDKMWRVANGYPWFADEQPSQEIRAYVEQRLDEVNWSVDVVLSHTTPLKYEPTEMFLKGYDQSRVDKSTEIWLDEIENKLDYKKWYCGHYHCVKKVDKLEIMFENYEEIGDK
jgi:3-oxoacid CoA-transferase subunit A